jgi:membrane-associated phospholipid phosphatase
MSTRAGISLFPPLSPALAREEARALAKPFTRTSALLRPSEWVIAVYFAIAATRAAVHGRPGALAVDLLIPLILASAAVLERRRPALWITVFRDWATMPLLLVAYWNVDWAGTRMAPLGLEHLWAGWDRWILEGWGARRLIEICGSFFPGLLELCYSLLYASPPLLLGAIYLYRRRLRAEWFLFTLFAATLTTYALLPLFPLASPRLAFPGWEFPAYLTVFRRWNVWLLEIGDIRTSVFPSGHVTVAFAAAFGIRRALPDRRWLGRALIAFAAMVAINTVYARYHYALDGVAALAISCAAASVASALETLFPGLLE